MGSPGLFGEVSQCFWTRNNISISIDRRDLSWIIRTILNLRNISSYKISMILIKLLAFSASCFYLNVSLFHIIVTFMTIPAIFISLVKVQLHLTFWNIYISQLQTRWYPLHFLTLHIASWQETWRGTVITTDIKQLLLFFLKYTLLYTFFFLLTSIPLLYIFFNFFWIVF